MGLGLRLLLALPDVVLAFVAFLLGQSLATSVTDGIGHIRIITITGGIMAVATQATGHYYSDIQDQGSPTQRRQLSHFVFRAIIDVIRQIRKSAAIEAMQATEALTYAQVAGLTTHGRRIGLTTD